MSILYGKFEMPEQLHVEEIAEDKCAARFVAEPFERGMGHTVGNSLRRMMLSGLEAPAIIGFRIEGIPHEFTAVEGIIEDMTNIVLNFKGALFRRASPETQKSSREVHLLTKTLEITEEMLVESGHQYRVCLKDVAQEGLFEQVNPNHHLFTATKPMKKRIDLRVAMGRGYVSSEKHALSNPLVDEILIDAIFTPVRLVNYFVEKTRVGQDTDFDKLIFDIHTDGRISPKEALSHASKICVKHLEIFEHLEPKAISFETDEQQEDDEYNQLMSKLALQISEIELSVRSTNCLVGARIDTIGELVIKPESEMLRYRNFGKKSLNEIKAKLTEMGLGLGMDLSRFGVTTDNIKEQLTKYRLEKQARGEFNNRA